MTDTIERAPEDLVERLRAEDARIRRLTRRLAWLPVLVGVLVVAAAYWSVSSLDSEVRFLRGQERDLETSIRVLQSEMESLQAQKARLAKEIDARETVFAEYERKLPTEARKQAAQLQAGIEHIKRERYQQAIESFDRVIESDRNNSLALSLKGSAYYEAKDYAHAVETLRRAVDADPNNAAARYNLALALAAAGSGDEAIRESDTAFKLDRNLVARAAADPEFWPLRRLRDARDAAGTAVDASEKEHIASGIAAAQAGRFEDAIAAYDRALKVNPNNANVLSWRGYALYRLARTEAARESLQRAVQANPRHAEAHYNLALVLWRSNARAEAAKALQRAFALDNDLSIRGKADVNSQPILRYIEQTEKKSTGGSAPALAGAEAARAPASAGVSRRAAGFG
jgi:tetratricopeptide (TPR) repeat protein